MSKTLDISWSFADPPVTATSWGRFESLPPPDAGDQALEARLGFPAGTLNALRLGFGKKLGRAVGWEDARPGAAEPSPVATAARQYKRGVASRLGPQKPMPVPTPAGSYPIKFLECAQPPVEVIDPRGLTIVDANVARLWPDLPAKDQFLVLGLDEHAKTLESVAKILDAWSARGRPAAWTIIGGGLLSDVGGYAARLAGARAQLMPTTLLAMADASVGGKTGVNFPPFGKNQVGAFYAPAAVHIWTGWLKTLPERELVAGGAECLKHCFLSGEMNLATKLANLLQAKDHDGLAKLLPDVVKFKADVVREDPAETGRRAILNFGHTLGHALESHSQKHTQGDATLLHGEAVMLGMVFATLLSRRVGNLPADQSERIVELIRQAGGIPAAEVLKRRLGTDDLRSPAFFAALAQAIGHDKKNTGGIASTSSWVLLDAPGKVARESIKEWTISLFETEIQAAMGEFLKTLRVL